MIKLLLISLLITGCSQQAMLDKFIPQEEVEFSKHFIGKNQNKTRNVKKIIFLFLKIFIHFFIVWK